MEGDGKCEHQRQTDNKNGKHCQEDCRNVVVSQIPVCGVKNMQNNELLNHLDKLHTTELGVERIKRNLALDTDHVVDWCRNRISSVEASISRKGKNWYITVDGCIITVNAYSYTIITAHKVQEQQR